MAASKLGAWVTIGFTVGSFAGVKMGLDRCGPPDGALHPTPVHELGVRRGQE
jgi:hypothetical protein